MLAYGSMGGGAAICLTDEVLVALTERRLSPDELARVHGHAAECAACHDLVALVAQGMDEPDNTELAPTYVPPQEVDDSWTPPGEFDEFRLERELGRGGMGMVYLAHDVSLDRKVAVKFIASRAPGPLVRRYFQTEAHAIARLQHPNVVTVFRVGKVEDRPYIVSEYIRGQSLEKLSLPLPWRRVLAIGVGLVRGLAAAHRQGVLHRDLKPSNALITEDEEVKLLDFGLAERYDPSASSRAPGAHTFAGTPRYMAPELRRGSPATPQSDLYALGLVLHELCTGNVPSQSQARTKPVEDALDQEPAPVMDGEGGPSLSERVPGIDPDFAALIERCLNPDPARRFASADLLGEALERLEQLHASTLLAPGNPYRGLASFEAEHRALFFGRDADIRAVLERLRRQPMVLVAADSGVGKSSLCRAGILPRVMAGALDEERAFSSVTLWPGRRPLEALAAALAPVLGRKEAELFTALEGAPAWLGQALRETYQRERGLLLFVDHIEELVTLSEQDQAIHFARILGELAFPAPGVRVLLAVRGDFLTRVTVFPGLGEEAERALYLLRPISPEGVREAIVGPARARGVVFESEELIQTLVASTVQGAGSLPLLQFALAELWERRDVEQGRITRAALEEMGGVAGALSRHADGVLARLDAAQQQTARRLFIQLVTEEGTRIERGEDELSAGQDDTRAVLDALVEGRLLQTRTAAGQARYRIAHDSLIRSWGMLRNWLDDHIGHRAVRQRVETASAEWERLARGKEALWGKRQLQEARLLAPSLLGPRETAFLQASRRALTRRRWRGRLAALLIVIALASVYGSLRYQAHRADVQFVAAQAGAARQVLAEGSDLGQRACARREEALALFDGRAPPATSPGASPDPGGLWNAAEQRWAEALKLRNQADDAYTRGEQALERALDRDYGRADSRQLLAGITYARLLLAECFHPQGALAEDVRRLQQRFNDAEWRKRVAAPAELELVTHPSGARVEIERYVDVEGVLRREPIPELGQLGPTPIAHLRLPAGSYLLHVTRSDRAPVTLPLLLTRGQLEQVDLTLPVSVPKGYAYVPPSCFLLGSDGLEAVRRGFWRSAPIHRVCMNEGYLIGKTEVTFGEWLAYLSALPPEAPARRILERVRPGPTGAVTLRQQPVAGWIFSFYRSATPIFTAWEGEDFRYPGRTRRSTADWRRFPLSGVSAEDLEGYLSWLNRSGRLPGARLCNEHEWERAARGADGRAYPHGDQLLPDDANIDATYGRQPTAFGPDEVGAHPESLSPFGLADMAGNADELTRPVTPELGPIVLRGGSWYYNLPSARADNRSAGDPTQRSAVLGARVCASFPPR